ncbi:MAG: serine/threonine protein kinase [Myxococcales bacterium]|nr:serine/threonine protein kinase [Myxococcales bacterium]
MTSAKDADEPEFPLPRRFGRYVLFDHIGRGGMAEIYLARGTTQMGAARLAVVKLVLNRFANDPAFAQMLVTEAKLAARLSHANVVQTFDLGREEERLYIAMEYVEGFDLTQLLRKLAAKKIGLPAEYGFLVVTEMLRALDYAHRCTDDRGASLGIVHRDVSPSNVLISLEGEVKLCDFGIARAIDDLSELPEGALEGKAAYMSPEQAKGEKIDARADVFAATTILWEIMAGRRMYKSQPGRDVLELAKAGDVPPLPNRGLPNHERLQEILSKGLAADRDARYASAAALLAELEDYIAEARLLASPMRFAQFLTEQFEHELVAARREREQAALSVVSPEPVDVIPDLPSVEPPEPPPEPAAVSQRAPAPPPAEVAEVAASQPVVAPPREVAPAAWSKPPAPFQAPPGPEPGGGRGALIAGVVAVLLVLGVVAAMALK